MDHKILIFDFDGTIADTFHLTYLICQSLADEFNYKKITPDDIEPLKSRSSQDVLKYLGIPIYKVPSILLRAREESHKAIDSMEPIKDLKKVLIALRALGCTIGILTSNSQENVMKFLKRNDMECFDFIKTSSKIWGKEHSIKQLIKDNGYSRENVVYIGDETRDIDAARKSKIKSIAVTWGYNSMEVLKKHKPDIIISCPSELVSAYTSI